MPLIFDLEGNGLLPTLSKIHCLAIHDTVSKKTYRFRHNDVEDTIRDGLAMLSNADLIVGHNVIAFDIPALKKVYPGWDTTAEVKDTLVLVKITAPDIKSFDMGLYRRGLIPSNRIGSHSLEAWGYRLGKHKGDYAKEMEKKGLDPWATWNQAMEDYCVLDVEVTTVLWHNIQTQDLSIDCDYLEHEAHTVASEIERNGFPFDKAAAEDLASVLETNRAALHERIVAEYGVRVKPAKKKLIRPLWYDPDGINLKKEQTGQFERPDPSIGEDTSRSWWGAVTVPKRNMTRNGCSYVAGAPYCKAILSEFNPGSRQQVVEVLTEKHGWVPTEFTDGGSPSVDGPTLEKLSATVPIAKDLAEIFFLDKILGQLKNGPQAWLKTYNETTGAIHCHIDTGGTVTGRCTHSKPNLGQVPAVIAVKTMKDDEPNPEFFDQLSGWKSHALDYYGHLKKEAPLLGRKGEYGYECRSLFGVPEPWIQVGVDLSGIEFRALAHLTAEFDGGELVDVVLNGDIHAYNQQKTGIPTRDIVKRVLYGLLYGAGDYKLGITAKPTASPAEAKKIGAQMRAQLMEGLPALDKAIKKVKAEAQRGFIIGLDGRRIKVRSEHSALNTRLQSDAAIIAKRWVCLTRSNALDAGAVIGWQTPIAVKQFNMLAFVHDELQVAVSPAFAEEFAKIAVEAAAQAGRDFEYRCPVAAEAKLGFTWADCH